MASSATNCDAVVDTTDGCLNPETTSPSLKYDDGDLTSKKRKKDELQYDVLFSSNNLLNSTLNDKQSTDNLNSSFISENPSNTSGGYENTFKVLEAHMHYKSIISSRQLEKFLRRHQKLSVPLNDSASGNFLQSINELEEDDQPSFFELELEASSRLRDMINRKNVLTSSHNPSDIKSDCTIKSPLNNVPLGDTQTHPNPEVFTHARDQSMEVTGDYPEYLYHVAKGDDGRMYLKVVRSMLLDKGKALQSPKKYPKMSLS